MTVATVKITLNGNEYNLTDQGNGVWSTSITAPTASSGSNYADGPGVGPNATNGYYPAVVTVADTAGNVTTVDTSDATFGDTLKLAVLEKTAPTGSITYPTQGAYVTNATPEFQFSFADAGSGIDPDECYISIDNGTAVKATVDQYTTGYATVDCVYTPGSALADGPHSISVYCKDYDGNISTTYSASFTVDVTLPVLSVTSPVDNSYVNSTSVALTGTCSDATSGLARLTVAINGGSETEVTVTEGAFNTTITLVANQSNSIVVTVYDTAGNSNSVTRTVYVDTIAPTISAITLTPNPADGGATLTISVTVSDS